MGKVLYRKYRSKSFDEVVGQAHITDTLQEAIRTNKLAHAYLFTGPRGVGKTSVARILAHEVNGLPYDEKTPHIDIIEIDAASNRRIDEIRELRDKVHISPVAATYKVYIIDEVHMLTKEAFNALLKTLEEPPAHAIFILATTEAHKLPETIISRTQRFTFKPISERIAVKQIQAIAKKEGIKISEEAALRIAEHGQGSFRDSLSLLDQVASGTTDISLAVVDDMIGLPPKESVDDLLERWYANDIRGIMQTLDTAKTDGLNSSQLAKTVAATIRSRVVDGTNEILTPRELQLLLSLAAVQAQPDTFTALELALLTTIQNDSNIHAKTEGPVSIAPEGLKINKPHSKSSKDVNIENKSRKQEQHSNIETKSSRNSKEKLAVLDKTIWPDILSAAKKRHNTLYSVLRMAEADVEDGQITLSFAFGFHQKRIEDAKNQQMLNEVVESVVGGPVTIVCVTNEKLRKEGSADYAIEGEKVQAISNIFGDVEMLQ